jgi:hypothetical protein
LLPVLFKTVELPTQQGVEDFLLQESTGYEELDGGWTPDYPRGPIRAPSVAQNRPGVIGGEQRNRSVVVRHPPLATEVKGEKEFQDAVDRSADGSLCRLDHGHLHGVR